MPSEPVPSKQCQCPTAVISSVSTSDLTCPPRSAQPRQPRDAGLGASSPRTGCGQDVPRRLGEALRCAINITRGPSLEHLAPGPVTSSKSTVRIRSLERHHLSHPIRTITAQHPPNPKHSSPKTETVLQAQPHIRPGRERCLIAQMCTRGCLSPHICCRTPSVTGTAPCHWTAANEVLTEFALVAKPGRRSRLMPFFQFGSVSS